MGTRASISLVHPPSKGGKVETIMVTFDGYPSRTGNELLKNYWNFNAVEELVKQGDIKTLLKRDLTGQESTLCDNVTSYKESVYDEAQFHYLSKYGAWYVASQEDTENGELVFKTLEKSE